MKKIHYLFFFSVMVLTSPQHALAQNDLSFSVTTGLGYTRWVDVLSNLTIYDASGNVIENVQIKTIGAGASHKISSKFLYRYKALQIGIGGGWQRDYIDYFRTESDFPEIVVGDTTYVTNKIFEIEYYFVAGFNLFESEKLSSFLNFNVGSFYVNSDYNQDELQTKLQAGVECEFNYLLGKSIYLQVNPKYEFSYLSVKLPQQKDFKWSIHNTSASVGICKRF